MLFTNARVVPHIARACFVSFFGAIVTAPSAMAAVTSLLTTRRNVPRLPLALSVCPDICTSTPLGTATGAGRRHGEERQDGHGVNDLDHQHHGEAGQGAVI